MSRFKIRLENRNKRCCWLLIGKNEEKVESRMSVMLPFTGPGSTQEARVSLRGLRSAACIDASGTQKSSQG